MNLVDERKPDRNIALELVRVTEAAAIASAQWMGMGNKTAADQAAVDAMRRVLNTIDMDGIVVIGEGEKDQAPMLYNGERLGSGRPPQVDIAVDPIDGTRLLAYGKENALSVVALAERGSMFDPGPCVYMEKMVVGPEAADVIDLNAPLEHNIKAVAKAKELHVNDIVVLVLDRERNASLVEEARRVGARVKLLSDGDIAAAIMTCRQHSTGDMLVGIGGTPEGVTAACAVKSFGGQILGRLWPRSDEERKKTIDLGYDLTAVLTADDLVRSNNVFFAATGITDGELLEGVRFRGKGATTHSLVMRTKSGTIREIKAEHDREKLRLISSKENSD